MLRILKFTSSTSPLFSDNGKRAIGRRYVDVFVGVNRDRRTPGNYVCIIYNLTVELSQRINRQEIRRVSVSRTDSHDRRV